MCHLKRQKAIIGYATGLDMTLRDQQNILKGKGHPWEKAKCFDNAAIVSEFILKEGSKTPPDTR